MRFVLFVTGTAGRWNFGTLEYMQPGRRTAGVATVFEIRRDARGDAATAVARAGCRLPGPARLGDGHEAADGAPEAAVEQ